MVMCPFCVKGTYEVTWPGTSFFRKLIRWRSTKVPNIRSCLTAY